MLTSGRGKGKKEQHWHQKHHLSFLHQVTWWLITPSHSQTCLPRQSKVTHCAPDDIIWKEQWTIWWNIFCHPAKGEICVSLFVNWLTFKIPLLATSSSVIFDHWILRGQSESSLFQWNHKKSITTLFIGTIRILHTVFNQFITKEWNTLIDFHPSPFNLELYFQKLGLSVQYWDMAALVFSWSCVQSITVRRF